jgi:hypothetical protein
VSVCVLSTYEFFMQRMTLLGKVRYTIHSICDGWRTDMFEHC